MGKKVELLAPAGNREGFYGAIHAGADAVYLGGSRFGARAYAENFSGEELLVCIKYAHLWGRRVYLTVNTLLRESELDGLYEYLAPFYEAGLDGVIVQDIGVFVYIRERFPLLPLHVSTQMTVTGPFGASLLADMGAARIVPARELSLEEIRGMKEACGLEIETFVHGAMCYCYSGQCLFSSILGGRSGNRGRCAQPCRLPYRVTAGGRQGKECYPLSLKDMCTIEHLPELIEAGIDSFKIEGRMKKPEYTAGVTAVYRKYIDRYYAKQENGGSGQGAGVIEEADRKALSSLYIRSERQNGYYFRHGGGDMVALENPAYGAADEALLGQIRERYLGRRLSKEVDISARLAAGKAAEVVYSCGGLQAGVTGEVVQKAQKQPVTRENVERQLTKLGESIFKAGRVEITLDENVFYPLKALNELRREAVRKLEDELIREAGLGAGRESCGHEGDADRIFFSGKNHGICMESCGGEDRGSGGKESGGKAAGRFFRELPALFVSVRTQEQLEALGSLADEKMPVPPSRIYVDSDLCVNVEEKLWQRPVERLAEGAELYLALPYILRAGDSAYLEKALELLERNNSLFKGCMIRSLEGWAFLRKAGFNGRIAGDAGIYVWNTAALDFWRDKLESFCLPLELNAGEQRILLKQSAIPAEKLVYGRIPMMVTANCVANTENMCRGRAGQARGRGKGGAAVLTDRLGKRFPVELDCDHCMNIIYNSVPLSLHSSLGAAARREGGPDTVPVRPRLDFTVETGEELCRILRHFGDILKGKECGALPFAEYTTGHEKRGVE